MVRVIRNESPVKYDEGPNVSAAAAVARRKICVLSGAGCCSLRRIKIRVSPVSGFQKLGNNSF